MPLPAGLALLALALATAGSPLRALGLRSMSVRPVRSGSAVRVVRSAMRCASRSSSSSSDSSRTSDVGEWTREPAPRTVDAAGEALSGELSAGLSGE